MEFATADLVDDHGDELQSCETQFVSYGGLARFAGPVETVQCFRDNALVKRTLGTPGDGRVLVVDGAGEIGVSVSFGGVEFRPGTWLYSDEDGVVVAARRLV